MSYQESFHLQKDFVANYASLKPPFGPIGEFIYRRTYSREMENGKTETWYQTVQRIVEGVYTEQLLHCRLLGLPWNWNKAQTSARIMYDLIFNMKFLPPGRGLWMMGSPYVRKAGGAALNSCAFVSTKDISTEFSTPFVFAMDMLMLGVGVGSDTRGAGKKKIRYPKITQEPFIVEDSREGWVDLIRVVLDSFVGIGALPVNRDYSKVRPYGKPIRGFGGVASGPEPLERLVQDICSILSLPENTNMVSITSTQISDIMNAIGKCVVAGNVRRSAEIMFGTIDDKDFLALKNSPDADTYPKPEYAKNSDVLHGPASWRWASNNSVIIRDNEEPDYRACLDNLCSNGEPGFLWLDKARAYGRMLDEPNWVDSDACGTNPCGEQILESYELCCLCETFPSRHKNMSDFLHTLKYAYLYAKSVSLCHTHYPRTNAVALKNRRIGMSMTGITAAIARIGIRSFVEWCDSGYNYLKQLDKLYSDWLCVPMSKKITSVKPSGTVSLLPGVPPGVHFPHAEHYIRRIRVNDQSPFVEIYKKAGYVVEKDVITPNTMIISFPVKENNFLRSKKDVSAWEQIRLAALLQRYWADNQVSVTVTFKKEEEKQLLSMLEYAQFDLKCVTFLPESDAKYAQMPYETIDKDSYVSMKSKIKPVRADTEAEVLDRFCNSDTCELN